MQIGELMLTKQKFTRMVEDTVKRTKLSYIDSVVHLCEKNNLELEDMKKYISDPIKEKIEAEAMDLNFLESGAKLPI